MTDVLSTSYERCRRLHRRYGKTYYTASLILPPRQRRHAHALYGFCRYADEIVDGCGPAPDTRVKALDLLEASFVADHAARRSEHPILAALVDTMTVLDIDAGAVHRFLRSMRMDLTIARYDTWNDLCRYMDGSAAVIGEMMLPVLEPADFTRAVGPARDLGLAFQLTNFIRDVDEDLRRGRVYLPQEDLDRFEADPRCRVVTPAWKSLMAFQIDRARSLYASADAGIDLLPPRSAACIRAARQLYSAILDRIEVNGYDVFACRATVPSLRKAATAARCLAGTIGSRNP